MQLHDNILEFNELVSYTADLIGISESAIRRDYYIVMVLKKLSESKYCDSVVFKGGTSLSKCYPNSINRFSEDIDLTFIPKSNTTKNEIENTIKDIEKCLSTGFNVF